MTVESDFQAWRNLADELNDFGVDSTVDDFDEMMVAAAKRHAERYPTFPFPPGFADFDRWYTGDFGKICPRCYVLNPTGRWQCYNCGIDMTDLS